jgi:hypothetical protein
MSVYTPEYGFEQVDSLEKSDEGGSEKKEIE